MVFGGGQQGVSLGVAYASIELNLQRLEQQTRQAQNLFQSALTQIGGHMERFGNGMSALGGNLALLTAPLAGFGVAGLKAASSFDSAMTMIAARTGLTGEALEEVRGLALQLGADTVFSGQQAADAFLQLLTAGLSVEQAMATLPAVLNGAAASGADLGQTADQVTNIMAAFGLEAERAGEIVQTMSAAAASSPASMSEMGEALQLIGGFARGFGLDLEDTSAILAVFASNGVRGSEAATQLRSVLTQMGSNVGKKAMEELGVAMYDASGNARDLDAVFKDLRVALNQLPVEDQNRLIQEMAGAYGQVGFRALLATDGFAAMEESMRGQADVTEVAAQNMGTFANTVESLKGSVETLMIEALTPFMNDVLKPLINQMIEATNRITEWVKANPALTMTIAKLSAGLLSMVSVLIVGGKAIAAIGSTLTILGAILTGPVLLAIGAVAAAVFAWRKDFLGIRSAIEPVIEKIGGFFKAIASGAPVLISARILLLRLFGRETGGQIIQAIEGIVDRIRYFAETVGMIFDALASPTSMGKVIGLMTALSRIFPPQVAAQIIARLVQVQQTITAFQERVSNAIGAARIQFQSYAGAIRAGVSAWDVLRAAVIRFTEDLFGFLGVSEEVTGRVTVAFYRFSFRVQEAVARVQRILEIFRLNLEHNGIKEAIDGLVMNVVEALNIHNFGASGFFSVTDFILEPFQEAFEAVKRLFSEVGTFIGKAFGKIDLKQVVKIGTTLLSLTNPLGVIKTLFETIFSVNVFDVFIDFINRLGDLFANLNSGQSLTEALGLGGTGVEEAAGRIGSALGTLIDFVTGTIIPGLQQLGDWFISEGFPAAIDFVVNTALPALLNAFTGIIDFVTTTVIPGLQTLANWFISDVLPVVVSFVQGTVIPAVQAFFKILSDAWAMVGPALQGIANWFINDALPAIVAFVQGTVIPAVQGLIQRLSDFWTAIQPGLQAFFDWVVNNGLPLVVDFFNNIIVPAVQTLIDILMGIWDAVAPALTSLFNWFMEEGLPRIQDIIENVVMPVLQTFIDIIATLWSIVQPALASLLEWFTTYGLPVIQSAIDVIITVATIFVNLFKNAWDSVKPGLEAFRDGVQGIFDWIGTNVIAPITQAFQDVLNFINDVLSKLGLANQETQTLNQQVHSGGAGAQDLFNVPQHARGIDYVPHDQLAFIHKGEAVLTAGENAARRHGGLGGMQITVSDFVVNANNAAEGQAAGEAFAAAFMEKVRMKGL